MIEQTTQAADYLNITENMLHPYIVSVLQTGIGDYVS